MFTGIIRELALVRKVLPASPYKLFIHSPLVAKQSQVGDSISVSGCCLTVTEIDGEIFTADVALETIKKTSLGQIQADHFVNIELAMQVGSRFDGHIVQGHVDGRGKIEKKILEPDGSITVWVEAPTELLDTMVEKGSIAVDGVSLTVIDVGDTSFSFMMIPLTQKHTTLGKMPVGSIVNLETDIMAKYLKKYLGSKNYV